MTLAGAVCWALSTIMVRLAKEAASIQVLTSNALLAVCCATLAVRTWTPIDAFSLCMMIAAGIIGALAQFLILEGLRHAPASLLAPTEYLSFVWAFLIGYAVWNDIPAPQVCWGAMLIVASGGILLWSERQAETFV